MNGDDHAAPFSKEEIAQFYLWIISRYQKLEIEFPEGAGWKLINELRGEPQDDVPSPVLFNVYRRVGDERLVITSETLHKSYIKYSGATNPDAVDPTDQKSIQKAEQAKKARKWTSLIARCSIADFDTMTDAFKKAELMMIGTMAWDVIKRDLITIDERDTPDHQELRSKEASAAYLSGLINFLVASGKRAKKGNRRNADVSEDTPWEFTAIQRVWQFVAKHFELPTQDWLRRQLESEGITYESERGQGKSKWRTLFERAGLETLKKI